jgi:threonine/homoserine/homoserine lactone efflux protein
MHHGQAGLTVASFVPDLPVILAFALAAFILAITPGPDMALQISRAINHGFWHGIATGAGAMSGIVVHTTLVAVGISVLIVAAPAAFLALKIVGAVYLLWLAYGAIVHGSGLRIASAGKSQPTLWQSYLTGVGINLLNPKVVLFFVTFLPQFVDAHDPAASQKLFFLGGEFILVSIPPLIATVYFAQWIADAFRRTKWVERALNYGFAAVFATFAAVILTAQARH